MSTLHPPDAPPSYESATGSGSGSGSGPSRISMEGPPSRTERNGIPAEHRRSMEDEHRELPPGWIRQFDAKSQHQFFVDTTKEPPRSIWIHPYDDQDFLATLSPEERKKHSRLHRSSTLDDIATEDTDNEDDHHGKDLPPRGEEQPKGIHKFGRKMKDKVTGSTHEQREKERREREEQERRIYAAHMKARQAMSRAMETGQPQFLGKDARGKDVYVVPPGGMGAPRGAYGWNPYSQGPYGNPNARYMAPTTPYGRRYGYGYGGGLGMPVAAGFLGGAMMGGLLF